MPAMTPAQRDAFLHEPRIALLTTLYADGSPLAVPIWFDWDGERARVFTSRRSEKVRRIGQDQRVCLTVAEPAGVPEAWVAIEGTAIVRDGGWEVAQRLAPRYYPPDKAEQALRDWGADAEQWVVVEITPRRIRSMGP